MKKRLLKQSIFKNQPKHVVVACVDFDGLLKYGTTTDIRYTWASERWRGCDWSMEVKDTDYEPLTMIIRDSKRFLVSGVEL